MENIFRNSSENIKIVRCWLQLRMNKKFDAEINLHREYVIDIIGSGLIIPTLGLSRLNFEQKSYLYMIIRTVNSKDISIEEIRTELIQ